MLCTLCSPRSTSAAAVQIAWVLEYRGSNRWLGLLMLNGHALRLLCSRSVRAHLTGMPQQTRQPDSGDQEQRWFELATQKCKHCGDEDWSADYGERTLLLCTACGRGCAHVGCEETVTGQEYGEDFMDSGADWFCCQVRCGRDSGTGRFGADTSFKNGTNPCQAPQAIGLALAVDSFDSDL
jgi:hypothetical protein